jgi:hypothetical protein
LSSISITNATRGEHVEHLSRLLARRVALGLALYRSDMKAAARAAGRIRLPELGVSAEEENAARYARATLGRAIRDARARALRAPIIRPAFKREEIIASKPSRRRLALFTTLAAAVGLIIVILLLGQPGGPLSGVRAPGTAGTASSQQILDATNQSRGRTTSFTQQVAVGKPTGTPAPAASNPANSFDRDDFHGGGGGGGSGSGGSGTGGVGIVPVPPAIPGPTPIPSGYVRFHGRIFDAATGAPLPAVCVIIGSLDCGPDKPHSDADGYWEATVTLQPYWDFGWQKVGYAPRLERLYSFGQNDVLVQDIRLSH